MLLLILSYSFFQLWRKVVTTEFAYQPTESNTWLVHKLKTKIGDYNPPWWYNTHIGALIPFGKSPNLKFERELFALPDGSVFGIDWFPEKPTGAEKNGKICIHLPGLGLSSDAIVPQVFVKTFADEGFITGILVPRGHSSVPLGNANIWNAGRTEDCNFFMESMYQRYASGGGGKATLFLTGFSASSSIVTKSLIELDPHFFQEDSPLRIIGAMCGCVNYDYAESVRKLETKTVGKFYSFLLAFMNQKFIHANPQIHEKIDPVSLQKMKSARTISEFDSAAHIVNGFRTEKEMYDKISSFPGILRMPVPFLALLAGDDPLYSGDTLAGMDKKKYVENPNVILMETSHGNHFGYVEDGETSYTYPARVALLFSKHLEDEKKKGVLYY